ncbi:MAG: SpoIIE family protein phosphatase [Acidobacteriia bacterium]|nr:SpoIIE family protein phosphatase [Terriglobia bacterium]
MPDKSSNTAAPAANSNLSLSGLQALLESARLLNSSLSLEELLRHLLRTVMGRLLVTRGAIAIEDHGQMRVELARGVHGIAKGSVFQEADAAAAKLDLWYSIGDPGRPVGVLALGKPVLGKLTPEQHELLLAMLELAATALGNARAHEQTVRVAHSLDQSVQELRAILDLARGLAAKIEADEIAHLLALTLAGRWTSRRHAVAAWRDGHPPVIRQRGIVLPGVETLRAAAAELTEPAYTDETVPDGIRGLWRVEPGSVVFPIRTSEEAIGIVVCGARATGLAYSPADLEFGAGLIAQAAVAFENAWRLQEILAQKKLEQELAIAAGIQESLFPSVLPSLAVSDLAARNRQARQVGGDYYDALPMDSGKHLLCVADISGKGLPAALLMANIQATLRAIIGAHASLADLATRVNALLHASTPSNRFATAFFLAYDPATGSGTYVNGGHNDGIVLRKDDTVELLTTTGLPLGLFARAAYEEGRVSLEPGDLLMIYSDGVTEAEDGNDGEFGMERVIEVLKSYRDEPASVIVDRMFERIDAFAGTAPQHDDITLMVLKRMS